MSTPLFRPVKPLIINQNFGENKACIPIGGGVVIVCDGNSPPPGYKSLYGPAGHLGTDMAAKHNQPVYAPMDGRVYKIDTNEKSGLDVRVECEWQGRKLRYIVEHLLGYQPKVGDNVKAGELLGWADNTGYAAGDHLHFQLEELLGGIWTPIDCMPLMSTLYAQDIRTWQELLARLADLLADLLRSKK